MEKQTTFLSGLFIMFSIVFGAFGAHALKDILTVDQLHSFDVAVRYQGFLSLGIFILALNSQHFSFDIKRILMAMLLGMILFSFSIYFLVLSPHLIPNLNLNWLGIITPIGGGLTIISWAIFLFRLLKY